MFCYFIRFVVNSSVFFNFLRSFLTCIFSYVFFQLFWFFRGGQVSPIAPPADAHASCIHHWLLDEVNKGLKNYFVKFLALLMRTGVSVMSVSFPIDRCLPFFFCDYVILKRLRFQVNEAGVWDLLFYYVRPKLS